MKLNRRAPAAALAAAVLAAAFTAGSASAQFSIPGLDPKRAAVGAAAKSLAPYIAEQTPIRLDPVELYPTVDTLPGAPVAPRPGAAAQSTVASVIAQLKQSNTGTVSLAPGDYAVVVRLYCMSHARSATSPLSFVLGPMRGKRAPAIVAMNSRAAASSFTFSPLQTTSWEIQGGLGYRDFPAAQRAVVDTLIPDYESMLGVSTLDEIQGKWSSLSSAFGAPSLDSILGQLGGAGQLVVELRDERSQILSQAGDFEALRRTFAPLRTADVTTLPTPWSVISPTVWMRMLTQGHYGDLGTVQIRIASAGAETVPLVSSIGYGRCTPEITSRGSAYACTQPLSFVPQRTSATSN
ncbi:MAG: hypothetical protein NVS3B7_05960 [Candidatus Elarobacter sp.]